MNYQNGSPWEQKEPTPSLATQTFRAYLMEHRLTWLEVAKASGGSLSGGLEHRSWAFRVAGPVQSGPPGTLSAHRDLLCWTHKHYARRDVALFSK